MKVNTKKDNQKYHSRKRTLQRFGVELSRKLEKDIVELIKKGKTEVRNISYRNNRSIHRINTELLPTWSNRRKYITVVYDKKRRQVVTVW